ncbi:stress responsive A/B barrel domain protein [Penicillium chermesinum]|uniref:Stress responsive A/B barrel domain protein n=1 Tax=Penicillium chermesinum TaxID=63820 RepID=A0A9W9PH59_9EURO|nr:stress responsive A/B barrel domain protein [Penicillium chermesinum]KAJ5246645.1 stress responsive A/B barrel domain protein [Penicillium chermesinum]KAJ6144917.1 stress responsive A/B barrel domain protein [Penicillium chermesinum]
MSITHIVLLQLKPDVDPAAIQQASMHFLSLKDTCVNPTSKQPYILKISGGSDNSPEGLQDGISHAFVVEFANEADRDYYVKEDPAHQMFKQQVGPLLQKIQVIDFAPELFAKAYSKSLA